MPANASALQLKYDFIPSVNPILASAKGADAKSMDLQIMISNPTTGPLSFSKITIQIPVGEDTALSLSSAPTLPSPTQAVSGDWKIAVSGSMITLIPAAARAPSTTVSIATILFKLGGIVLPTMPGMVPITVTEFPLGGAKVMDSATYSLAKLPNDFPVTNFYANPAALQDDAPTTLFWQTNDLGPTYTYNLHCDGWNPKTIDACYSASDGIRGIPSPTLIQATIFTLDIISSTGGTKIFASLTLKVPMDTPAIGRNARLDTLFNGKIGILRWTATGADYCSIQIDNEIYADFLPVDMYKEGYVVPFPKNSHSYSPVVTVWAKKAMSKVSAQTSLPAPVFSNPAKVSCSSTQGFAGEGGCFISDDGKTAILRGTSTADKTPVSEVLGLSAHPPVSLRLIPGFPLGFLPDQTLIVTEFQQKTDYPSNVQAYKVADGTAAQGPPIAHRFGSRYHRVQINGVWASQIILQDQNGRDTSALANSVVLCAGSLDFDSEIASDDNPPTTALARFDYASQQQLVSSPNTPSPRIIRVTPDHSTALALVESEISAPFLKFYDVASNTFTAELPYPGAEGVSPTPCIAFTPDGKFALVTSNSIGNSICIVDMNEKTILRIDAASNATPTCVTVMPNGTFAFVGEGAPSASGKPFLSVLDMRTAPPKLVEGAWELDAPALAVAVSKDNLTLVVSLNNGTTSVFSPGSNVLLSNPQAIPPQGKK